jgi:hypothetical protein
MNPVEKAILRQLRSTKMQFPTGNSLRLLSRIANAQCYLFLLVPLCLVANGCKTQQVAHKPIDPNAIQSQATLVRSVIVQDEVIIPVKIEHANPGLAYGGGGVGALVHAISEAAHKAKNKSRMDEAARLLAPLRQKAVTVEFRADHWDALTNALASSRGIRLLKAEAATKYTKPTIADIKDQPFLSLLTVYSLTRNCSTLEILTILQYFQAGNNQPAYSGALIYFSDEIGPERDEAAVAKWASDEAAPYKAAVREGIIETMKMLRADILEPVSPTGVSEDTKLKFRVPGSTKEVAWKGKILQRNRERLIFRKDGGPLFSIKLKS